MKKNIKITFWLLIVSFLFILCQFFVPAIKDLLIGPALFLGPMFIFFLLGLALIIFTVREKVEGKLKKFLLLTGSAATGFFAFVFLHNAFYALNVVTGHITVLNYLTEILGATFFLIAIFACPLGFLAGIAGTIYFLKK